MEVEQIIHANMRTPRIRHHVNLARVLFRASMYTCKHRMSHPWPRKHLRSRVDAEIKKRLAKLAQSTGRSRSFLTAEAIAEYLNTNEWQVAGIKDALVSVEHEGTIAHEDMEAWINSWGTESELTPPKPTRS